MDKLKTAGSEMDKFFSAAPESPKESPKKTTVRNTKAKTEKAVEEPQKAQEGKKQRKVDTHKVFSFRAEKESVDSWRVWADAKGMKVDDLGEKAITEYIRKHSLTEDQKKIYELKMGQKSAK